MNHTIHTPPTILQAGREIVEAMSCVIGESARHTDTLVKMLEDLPLDYRRSKKQGSSIVYGVPCSVDMRSLHPSPSDNSGEYLFRLGDSRFALDKMSMQLLVAAVAPAEQLGARYNGDFLQDGRDVLRMITSALGKGKDVTLHPPMPGAQVEIECEGRLRSATQQGVIIAITALGLMHSYRDELQDWEDRAESLSPVSVILTPQVFSVSN